MSVLQDGSVTLDTPEQINAFRFLAMRRGLRLEIRTGMRVSSQHVTGNVIRAAIGSKTRDKRKLYAELDAVMVAAGFDSLPLD